MPCHPHTDTLVWWQKMWNLPRHIHAPKTYVDKYQDDMLKRKKKTAKIRLCLLICLFLLPNANKNQPENWVQKVCSQRLNQVIVWALFRFSSFFFLYLSFFDVLRPCLSLLPFTTGAPHLLPPDFPIHTMCDCLHVYIYIYVGDVNSTSHHALYQCPFYIRKIAVKYLMIVIIHLNLTSNNNK